jgi:excisionase family DNA binding protein
MREHSISEVAKEIGVQRATLYEWIRTKKIPAPTLRKVSGVRFRFWSTAEVEKIKKYRTEHYREKPTLRKKSVSEKGE